MRKIGLFLLCCLFCQVAVVRGQEISEIPLQITPQGHLSIHVTVDGVEGNFVFDTGAGLNMFTQRFMDKLKQVKKEVNWYTGFRATGDRLDLPLATVPEMKIGSRRYREVTFSYLDMELGPFDGLISLKNFTNELVTVDYNRNMLIITPQKALAGIRKKGTVLPLQLEASRDKSVDIFCYVQVNKQLKLQFSMDTGSGKDAFRINSRYMPLLGVDPKDSSKVKTIVMPSEFKQAHENHIYITQLPILALADAAAIKREQVRVQFVDGLIYDGIMSVNWLGKVLTFSVASRELIIQQ